MTERANITISRVTDTHGPETIQVRIQVGKTIHHATLSLENYAMAISGMARVHCLYEERQVGA